MRPMFIGILTAAALFGAPAAAVIVLDSTWSENGGSFWESDAGFDAHFALAAENHFSAIMGLWDGEQFGGSGVWIGNDADGHAYLLTAAHNFDDDPDPAIWLYYTRDDSEFQGLELWIHPNYDKSDDASLGWDMAIVKLDAPMTGFGPAPYLYGGQNELGAVVTITGFGARGIGSRGEADRFYSDEIPAAARNVVDEVDGENGRNLLVVDFDSEDGQSNMLEGDALPVDEYEGVLGSGDSGGATWIETNAGWAVAGVNVWGEDPAKYGSISAMARISTQRAWIQSVFPKARFTN